MTKHRRLPLGQRPKRCVSQLGLMSLGAQVGKESFAYGHPKDDFSLRQPRDGVMEFAEAHVFSKNGVGAGLDPMRRDQRVASGQYNQNLGALTPIDLANEGGALAVSLRTVDHHDVAAASKRWAGAFRAGG